MRTAFTLWSFALFVAAVLGSASIKVAGAEAKDRRDLDPILKQRFVAYSKSFGQRFRLTLQEPHVDLAPGLEAIEIGFEPRPNSKVPRCYVALYLSSDIDIGAGLGPDASSDLLETDRHFFLHIRPSGVDPRQLMAREDAVHLLARQSRYFRRVGFTTREYVEGKSGGRTTGSLLEYVPELFPGIQYVRTRGCMPSWMVDHRGGVDIGLRRSGAPNYAQIPGPWRDEHFVRIALPDSLVRAAAPALAVFERHVQDSIDIQNRLRRERGLGSKASVQPLALQSRIED